MSINRSTQFRLPNESGCVSTTQKASTGGHNRTCQLDATVARWCASNPAYPSSHRGDRYDGYAKNGLNPLRGCHHQLTGTDSARNTISTSKIVFFFCGSCELHDWSHSDLRSPSHCCLGLCVPFETYLFESYLFAEHTPIRTWNQPHDGKSWPSSPLRHQQ